jgi:hypothetical protein
MDDPTVEWNKTRFYPIKESSLAVWPRNDTDAFRLPIIVTKRLHVSGKIERAVRRGVDGRLPRGIRALHRGKHVQHRCESHRAAHVEYAAVHHPRMCRDLLHPDQNRRRYIQQVERGHTPFETFETFPQLGRFPIRYDG